MHISPFGNRCFNTKKSIANLVIGFKIASEGQEGHTFLMITQNLILKIASMKLLRLVEKNSGRFVHGKIIDNTINAVLKHYFY